jgi:hypothetical protein
MVLWTAVARAMKIIRAMDRRMTTTGIDPNLTRESPLGPPLIKGGLGGFRMSSTAT